MADQTRRIRRRKIVLLRFPLLLFFFFFFFFLFHFALGQLRSSTERAALLELRSSLGLRSRDWPRNADPCSNWTGIQCDQKLGRVISINLSGLKRTRLGSLTPKFSVDSLTNFTHLGVFNASGFLLPGSIPQLFGKIHALQVLDLGSSSVSGGIPFVLGDLTNLNWVDLSKNSLSGVIPRTLFLLRNLTHLDLSSNLLSGPIPILIGRLQNLQILNLSSNRISGSVPEQVGNLSSLVELDLSSNFLSGLLPLELRQLRNLQKMVFRDNSLSGFLQDGLFLGLVRLEFVALSRNNLSGAVPELLWSLRFLDVSHNNFTGTIPNLSSNFNASASSYNLSHNQFYGTLGPQLGRLSSIGFSDNYFQGQVPEEIRKKSSLANNCLSNSSDQRTLEDCTSFYANRGLSFDNFGVPNTQLPNRKSNKQVKFILIGVFGGIGFIVLLVLVLVLCLRICKRGVVDQRSGSVVHVGGSVAPADFSVNISSVGEAYKYDQLLRATGEFSDSNLMKHGHSGDFFRGVLEGGTTVVIKKIDVRSFESESYLVELDFFSRIEHTRFVPLLGHCLEHENVKFLVYKYMQNGDLSNTLFRKTKDENDHLQSLDWITRLKIAIGAAEGLSYLHHDCTPPLVHRDVQASSILLDDKFEVRLGSLSEMHAQDGDPHQNVITRLLQLPQTSQQGASGPASTASSAYDVYCFGRVLLELITGKLGISTSSEASMSEWLEQILPYISMYEKDLVTKIIDPSLIVDEDLLEEVWAMAIVAKSCLNPKPSKRPLMRYILKALENPLKVVREDSYSSERLRTTSSRRSWSAAVFGSWRRSSSEISANNLRQSGMAGSQRSGRDGAVDHSSSIKRPSSDVFPELAEIPDRERSQEE